MHAAFDNDFEVCMGVSGLRTIASCAVVAGALLTGCAPKQEASVTAQSGQTAPAPSPLKPIAGIQDIMAGMIDPAADFLWASVSSTVTEGKTVEKQPRTPEEWAEVRRQAILLAEGANLIMMDGRHVVKEGSTLEDHGTPGNLTAEQSEQAIANNRASFIAFAQALRDVGHSMLTAADAKNPQGLIDAGDTMDQVCEGCHLEFWYPGQKIPLFPDQAPEEDAKK
jgi:hypothetical protein